MTNTQNYSVNAVKTFIGREGHGYTCNLLFQGKKVAEVINHANGGELRFHWLDKDAVAQVTKKNYKDELETHQGTHNEAQFEAMVMSLPKIISEATKQELTTNADIVLDDLVNEFLILKKVKADIKKSFTIQDTSGKIFCWKITAQHTEDLLKKFALNKYPGATVINDLPIEEVIEIYKKENIIA